MRSNAFRKINHHDKFPIFTIFIPLLFIVFLFFSQKTLLLIFLIFFFLIFISAYFFWQYIIFPHEDFKYQIDKFFILFSSIFKKNIPFICVENGVLDNDYFLLHEKPPMVSLCVDASSLVCIRDTKNNVRLLDYGMYRLNQKEELLHTFNTNLNQFEFIPEAAFSLGEISQRTKKKRNGSHGNTFHYNTTVPLAGGEKTTLSYRIFFRFYSKDSAPFLDFSKSLLREDFVGETESYIQKSIGIIIHKIWEKILSGKKYSQINDLIFHEDKLDANWIGIKIKQQPRLSFSQDSTTTFLISAIQKGFIKILFELNYELYEVA